MTINAADFGYPAGSQVRGFSLYDFGGHVRWDRLGTGFDPDPATAIVNTIEVRVDNHPPEGTDGTITTSEDTPYAFKLSDFGFSDPNNNPPDSFSAVQIVSLPGSGTLEFNSQAVAAGATIPVAALGRLVFTPAANANGDLVASFQFRVQDSGGTQNNGTDLALVANTLSINVVPVNDPMTGVPSIVNATDATRGISSAQQGDRLVAATGALADNDELGTLSRVW